MVFCIWKDEIFEKKEPTTKRFYGRVTWSMHLSCILYGMKWETIYTCDYNSGFKHLVSSLTQQRYDNPIQPDTQHKFANLSQFETVLQCCLWYSFLPTEHMTLQISDRGGIYIYFKWAIFRISKTMSWENGNPMSYSTQMLRSFHSTEEEKRSAWHEMEISDYMLGSSWKWPKICMTQHLCQQFMSEYFIYSCGKSDKWIPTDCARERE